MNRRDFLTSLLGLAAGAALPAKASTLLTDLAEADDVVFFGSAMSMFGAISNVKIYDRALSIQELVELTK